jgi:hypothetical protein
MAPARVAARLEQAREVRVRLREGRIDGERAAIAVERSLRVPEPRMDGAEVEEGLRVARIVVEGGEVVRDRLLESALLHELVGARVGLACGLGLRGARWHVGRALRPLSCLVGRRRSGVPSASPRDQGLEDGARPCVDRDEALDLVALEAEGGRPLHTGQHLHVVELEHDARARASARRSGPRIDHPETAARLGVLLAQALVEGEPAEGALLARLAEAHHGVVAEEGEAAQEARAERDRLEAAALAVGEAELAGPRVEQPELPAVDAR